MKQMMIYKSKWNDKSTFRMLPLTNDCPYNEAIFDPEQKILAIVSKDKKEKPMMLPRLSDRGDLVPTKRANAEASPWQEQRVIMETYYEYYIEDMEDIRSFIATMANIDDLSKIKYVDELLKA